MFGHCFVMRYLVSFLACSHLAEEERESWLFQYNCLPGVLEFCVSSS